MLRLFASTQCIVLFPRAPRESFVNFCPGSTSAVTCAPTGSMGLVLASTRTGRGVSTRTCVLSARDRRRTHQRNSTASVRHHTTTHSAYFLSFHESVVWEQTVVNVACTFLYIVNSFLLVISLVCLMFYVKYVSFASFSFDCI